MKKAQNSLTNKKNTNFSFKTIKGFTIFIFRDLIFRIFFKCTKLISFSFSFQPFELRKLNFKREVLLKPV